MRLAAAFCLTVCVRFSYAQQIGCKSQVLALDPPAYAGQAIRQLFQYCIPKGFDGDIHVRAYQLRADRDSTCLYDLTFSKTILKKGAGTLELALEKSSRRRVMDKSFFKAISALGAMPAGQYRASLTLQGSNGNELTAHDFLWSTDSVLEVQSPLRGQANELLTGGLASIVREAAGKQVARGTGAPAAGAAQRASHRLYRGLRKKGISVQTQSLNGKIYSAFYYEGWFLGRYELADAGSLKDRAAAEAGRLRNNASSLVSDNLDDFRSVSSQMRDLHKARKGEGGVDGTLEINAFAGTGQEPGSEQDNRYVELLGQISTEVMDLPVGVEGYYTTQDKNRQAKASYFRVRYDVDKAKGELLGLVTDYRRKYSETVSKGKGLEQVYGSYLDRLHGEQTALLSGLQRNYGLDAAAILRYDGDVERMLRDAPGGLDTSSLIIGSTKLTGTDSAAQVAHQKYAATKVLLLQNKAEIQKRYDQLQSLRQRAEKYRTLLAQYSDGLYLDSVLHGTKLQTLAADKNASYKDMAKAASGLLPEGKAKRFASGLTNLEAGILNKYESSYTWAGQTAKGGSIGYDLGFAQVSATVGKTEYVSRSGSVNRYSAYSGRADFEPREGHRLSFIYYGYSPSRSMISDERFNSRGVDLALPTFTAPIHIGSLLSAGLVAKSISYTLEGAASHRKSEATGKPMIGMANTAIKTGLEWAVPKTGASLNGEWEHLGRDFQNSSLPVTRTGTERYTVGGSIDLFKDFLHLGVQYHTLRQESFSSTGYNTRWGFDIRTRSKRYPTVVLSYKPFTTFRTYDDTLAIEQRPLVGAVWTGRVVYQIMRPNGLIHRFALLYNRNSTTAGGSDDYYRSVTAQATYLVTSAANAVSLNGGWMVTPQSRPDGTNGFIQIEDLRSYFLAVSWSRPLGKRATFNAGGDGAVAAFGLQRTALRLGYAYTLAKQPLSIRVQARLATFRMDAASDKPSILAAMLGASWRFHSGLQSRKANGAN